VFFNFFQLFGKMWGKFQKKSQLLINFEENEFFRTRNKFQKSFRNDVLPTDAFKNTFHRALF